ncbi:hypothetical protein KEJ49_00630 [Candidatus Bathyarchaeota archaeon]|nr:hypothetical protein [Candidatus Bathyarchaeota archaeon]
MRLSLLTIGLESFTEAAALGGNSLSRRDLFKTPLLILLALSLSELSLIGLWLFEKGVAERRPYSYIIEWVAFWGGAGSEYPRGVAVDGEGIYVAGSTTSYGSGREDIYLLKYSPSGELLWSRIWGGSSYDFAGDIATSKGNIYIAGLTAVSGRAWSVLLSYDSDGVLLWARVWRGVEGTSGRAVSLDEAGAIYVSGYVGGLPPTPTSPFLLKYDPEGFLEWSWSGGGKADYCWALALDGGIYLGGTRLVQSLEPHRPRKTEFFLTKLDYGGRIIWSRVWGAGVENYCWSLTSYRGRIYMVGFTQAPSRAADVVLLVYDEEGDLKSSCILGGDYEDYAWAVAAGGDYVYAVGHTLELGSSDALLIKFDLDGAPLWNMTWGGAGWDLARAVAVDGDCVYVAGLTYSLDNGPQSFLLKLRSPNTRSSPLESVVLASVISLGLSIWMFLILFLIRTAGLSTSAALDEPRTQDPNWH